jgi:hypothetical protein
LYHICTCMSDSRRGFGLDIGFLDHYNTRLVITLNYSAIANFQTLQNTRSHVMSLPVSSIFTRRFLVTASDNGYSSTSVLMSSLNGCSLSTASSCFNCSPYIPFCTDRVENTVSNSTSIIACVSYAAGTCCRAVAYKQL